MSKENDKETIMTSYCSFKQFTLSKFLGLPYPVGNSLVIRQKGESHNGCYKKTKYAKFPEKRPFHTPLIRTRSCEYQGGKKCSFFGKSDVLCFLVTPVLRFTLLPYYRRINLFYTNSRFPYPLKTSQNLRPGFVIFSGGIEMELPS